MSAEVWEVPVLPLVRDLSPDVAADIPQMLEFYDKEMQGKRGGS